ncbi:M20 family metallo-hydrolase [Methylobacterium platani]|uniref:Zn-dependent hydrolase n=1 Tax=Methylobacterium platani TaxID=427683 RepID=A0A179S0R0_9HYPH|nr:M20 family metallo-hydrolase [Methylobacterium platani]OAS18812.1 Zn-dependent hydrolase [Methylobacterium platani]
MARPSDHVDGARLWRRLMDLSRFGARPDGGVDRQTLTPAEIAARADLVALGRSLGLEPFTDAAANLFLRLPGRRPDLPPVMAGSHIDSQPTGGRFDGAFGVLAALEAVEAIRAAGLVPERPIEVVAFTNEEGSRFAPGMTGSDLFTGARAMAEVAAIRDAEGIAQGEALAAVLAADRDVPQRPFQRPVAAFVEPHIEQGPVLERDGVPIGVVTGIQGTRRYRVRVTGAAAHAGTAERHERRDALMAAVRMVAAIDRAASDPSDTKLTVGLFEVTPNAPSVVPAEVLFSIDLRHPDNAVVDRLDAAIRAIVEGERGPCAASLRQIQHNPSLTFSPVIRGAIAAAAGGLGLTHRDILSAAGHDARQLHDVCPTGMIFVPCRDGISHNPAEWAEPDDLAAGARVLADVLWQLANGDGPGADASGDPGIPR